MKQPDNVGSFSMDVLEIWGCLFDGCPDFLDFCLMDVLNFLDSFDGYLPVFFTPFKSSSK